MKFKVAEDIDAPVGMVFVQMTDFTGFEADARGRGADLRRVDNWTTAAVGVGWRGSVKVRSKTRAIASTVTILTQDETLVVDSRIGGMDCNLEMMFVPLSAERTRVAMTLEMKPDTLTARLILQTLKLARGRVLQRMTGALAREGDAIEADWRRKQRG